MLGINAELTAPDIQNIAIAVFFTELKHFYLYDETSKPRARRKPSPTASFLPTSCNFRRCFPIIGRMGFLKMRNRKYQEGGTPSFGKTDRYQQLPGCKCAGSAASR